MESPLEYPQPPSEGDQPGLPHRAGTDPDGEPMELANPLEKRRASPPNSYHPPQP